MISGPVVQVGYDDDHGLRDTQGREHGEWVWQEPITYIKKATSIGRKGRRVETFSKMMVEYFHGQIVKAKMVYDIKGKATKAYEEGRQIGTPTTTHGMPFKRGLWRGMTGNPIRPTIRFYDDMTVLWEYFRREKVLGWSFRVALLQDGMFREWWEIPKTGLFYEPPKESDFPERFNPLTQKFREECNDLLGAKVWSRLSRSRKINT